MVWVQWCFDGLEEKDESMNELLSNEGDCGTAPATPGPLKIPINKEKYKIKYFTFWKNSSVYHGFNS